MAELGNSNAVYPTAVGREHASVRTGGRRRRSSPRPRCNGEDMVKVRQGKPVKKEVNGRREEGRWRPFAAGAPLRRQRRIRPSRVAGPTGKRSARKRACSVWSGGKAAKPYLSLPCTKSS